jgi:uncharacterized membrane protein YphA (DoxX/SURF4 family)
MKTLFIVGRVLLALIFILSGIQKLLDLSATAGMIEARLVVPPALIDLEANVVEWSGMPLPKVLAVVSGVAELLGGLMIATGFGLRVAAVMLILFTLAVTGLFHDFWNLPGAEAANAMAHAMKNLSIVGALLMLFVIGPAPSDRKTLSGPALLRS